MKNKLQWLKSWKERVKKWKKEKMVGIKKWPRWKVKKVKMKMKEKKDVQTTHEHWAVCHPDMIRFSPHEMVPWK